MRVGDKVIVNMPNHYLRERFYWQPFRILEIRTGHKEKTVRLQGLCVPSIEITGDSLDALLPYKEVRNE